MTTITGASLVAKPTSLFARMRAALLNVEVPDTWDRLSHAQFRDVVAALHCGDERHARVRIAWSLLGMTWWRPLRVAALFACLTGRERFHLLRIADPFLDPKPMHRTKVPTLKVYSPKSGMVTTLYLCVEDLLGELDARTWGLVDACFLRFQASKDKDLDHLRAMAAYLYVRKGTTRDERLAGAGVKRANWLTVHQLHLVERQWRLLRLALERESPAAFSSTKKTMAARKLTWDDVIMELAGDVLGTYVQAGTLPARTLLRRLHNEIVDRDEINRKLDELKHNGAARR